jgi:hypothetical protein
MPRVSDPAKQLEDTIARLQERRRSLAAELARIDDLFAKHGLQPQETKRRGRPPSRRSAAAPAAASKAGRKGRRRKRGTFPQSAQESIVGFLKSKGKEGATTGEINEYWEAEGRAGSAYVTLGQLHKKRKVKREDLKGVRGSRYWAA